MKIQLRHVRPHQAHIIRVTIEWLHELYPIVPIVSLGEADLNSDAYARADWKRWKILFDPLMISTLDDYMVRWITCHEFGHLFLNVAEFKGYKFVSPFKTQEDVFVQVSEFAMWNMHKPQEVFAECFAASIMHPEDSYTDDVVAEVVHYMKENQ